MQGLSKSSELGAARFDLLKHIKKIEPEYPETNLKYLLPRLCTPEYGGVLRFDSSSARYSFSDPIYRAYAIAYFRRSGADPIKVGDANWTAFTKALEKLLNRYKDEKAVQE